MSNRLKAGRYELVRKLGEGAQGETWEAIDHADSLVKDDARKLTDRFQAYVEGGGKRGPRPNIAIKRFRVARATSWKDVELAEREAKTLKALSHPSMPAYHEHFEEDGALYLVMEKIEGQSVASITRSSPEEVMRMLDDVAAALRYLHGFSPPIVHRDIKPANVIRRPDGSFAIVDFGAVRDRLKPAGGSTVVGTFGYMAPEQFQGRASPKSDVYGAAATAIRMLTGEEPEALPHVGLAIDVAAALPANTPRALVKALERMTRPDPDARAGSIEEAFREEARPVRTKAARRETRREAREERRVRRWSHSNRLPLPIRFGAFIGLVIARLVVWLTVGVVAPIALSALAVIFGPTFRRAAHACVLASQRANARMKRSSETVEEDVQVRVDDAPVVRIAEEEEEEVEESAPPPRAKRRR